MEPVASPGSNQQPEKKHARSLATEPQIAKNNCLALIVFIFYRSPCLILAGEACVPQAFTPNLLMSIYTVEWIHSEIRLLVSLTYSIFHSPTKHQDVSPFIPLKTLLVLKCTDCRKERP